MRRLGLLWVLGGLLPSEPAYAKDSRPSITFVLGRDACATRPYYALSELYFRNDPDERTDQVVTSADALLQVRDHLARQVPGRPWGVINLVVHSNAWAGMDVPIHPGEGRTTVRTLEEAIAQGRFQPLPDSQLDARSEIRIQGCALGNDLALLDRLSMAFGGKDPQRPRVRSSRLFTSFHQREGRILRCLCEVYWVALEPNEKPSFEDLSGRFSRRYPGAGLVWVEALSRRKPRWLGDTYSSELGIPLRWTAVYPDAASLPRLFTLKQKMAWIDHESDLQARIQELGFQAGQFTWQLQATQHRTRDGKVLPAIRAKGIVKLRTVLRAHMENAPDPAHAWSPSMPSWEDERYYGASVPPAAESR